MHLYIALLFVNCMNNRQGDGANIYFPSSSAADKNILEAAYLSNPKPDKTARLDIVSRVSLNEKEVQVCIIPRQHESLLKSI